MKAYPDLSLSTLYAPDLQLVVDSTKALFSSWYELFPRSCGPSPHVHGTFSHCIERLPYIASMGFDILYLAPIYPVGEINRKGKNNAVEPQKDSPGSPWAIGSTHGGHDSIEPSLGTMEDFVSLVNAAASYGIEIALDLAFQCAPDHPYVKDHPQWFKRRPDGTIQFAENPPKRYEDIVPFDFETSDWQALWEELKRVVLFWIDKGVRIFRVDNPHTKPFPFWEWLIAQLRENYPDLIFLSEAFTRPKIMYLLSKAGFNQSYSYFTWRNTKQELTEYFQELTTSETAEYFRPNLWPNTPDILPEYLQFGGKNAFAVRLVLAATLSTSYGIYGPAYENAANEALEGKEEYADSEKYEIKEWNWENPPLKDLIAKVNSIRRENPALQIFRNLHFYRIDNEYLLYYGKITPDLSSIILVVVNIDPFHSQSGNMQVPIKDLQIDPEQSYLMYDLLGGERFVLTGSTNFITIDPRNSPACIFRVHRHLKRESDYDYY